MVSFTLLSQFDLLSLLWGIVLFFIVYFDSLQCLIEVTVNVITQKGLTNKAGKHKDKTKNEYKVEDEYAKIKTILRIIMKSWLYTCRIWRNT